MKRIKQSETGLLFRAERPASAVYQEIAGKLWSESNPKRSDQLCGVSESDTTPNVVKDITETPEFYIPDLGIDVHPYLSAEQKQGIHHVGRYQWAASVVRGKRILDVACGAGYGSKLLTEANPWLEMVGVDYDRRAIDFAKNNYSAPNISYLVGNAATWTDKHGRDLGSFDCIISFDTIEHLLHREIALIDFAENLTEQGMLMLSTPCKRLHNQLNPAWEHHKIEYSYEDLYNLLRRFFATVLHSEDGTLPNQSFLDSVINAGRVRYVSRMNPVVLFGAD